MSVSFNHIIIAGNLGKDPDIKYTPQGTPICEFTMAVNDRKKVSGEWVDTPVWFKIKVWGKQAEPCSQFLTKGRPAIVSGRLSIEEWLNRDGKNITSLVITAADVKFLGEKSDGPPRASTAPPSATPPAPDISDDDIPF